MKNIGLSIILIMAFTQCEKSDCRLPEWTNNISELYDYNSEKVSISQGIAGTLTQAEGNCMPVIDLNGDCMEFPVSREIHLYEYTTLDDVVQDSPGFYSEVNTNKIGQITADEEGFFELQLEEGVYSVFVKEDGKLYANSFNGQGGIQTIEILSIKVSTLNLKIDYAVY